MRTRGRYLLYAVGIGLFALLVWFYGPELIVSELRHMSVEWALLAAFCVGLVGLIGAINVYLLVARDKKIGWGDFLPIYWTSWAVGLVVPGQIGDLASMGFLLRRRVLPLAELIGRAVLDKAISLLVMLGFAVAGILTVGWNVAALSRWLIGLALLLLAACALLYATRHRLAKLFAADKPGIGGSLNRMLCELVQTTCQAPARVFVNIGLTITKIFITGLAYWAMFNALGETAVPVFNVTVLATAAGLVAYLPISLNGLGTVEAAGIFLFGQAGVAAATVISAYIVLRVLVMTIAWVPVFGWWAFGSRKPASLA